MCVLQKGGGGGGGKTSATKVLYFELKNFCNRHFMTKSSVKNISIVSRSLEAKLIIDWLVSLGGQKNILQQSRFQSKKNGFLFL